MYKNAANIIPKLEKQKDNFLAKLEKPHKIDESFALPEDEPLTKDEIKRIDEFWGKYSFAYPKIDYKSFATFKNRSGSFDVRHCPGMIRRHYLSGYFSNSNYSKSFTNKGMLGMLFPDTPQPRTVLRRMGGVHYNENYGCISYEEMLDIIINYLTSEGDLIVKINSSYGGKGIHFLRKEDATIKVLDEFFKKIIGSKAFVIQEVLKQSEFMSALNPSSVNTIRITTLLHKGQFHCLAALIRIGGTDSLVDNWSSGGSLLGIDIETGKCNSWAMGNDRRRITTLQSGVDLTKDELYVPNFEKVKEVVLQAHSRCPYMKMFSWDIALDKDDMPAMIENNHKGMIQIHEAVTGPVFGDFLEEILDDCLLKKHSYEFATKEFICKEFNSRVSIKEYIGKQKVVKIPEMINGKPVTSVDEKAFKGCGIKEVIAKESIFKKSPKAFAKIKKLTTV